MHPPIAEGTSEKDHLHRNGSASFQLWRAMDDFTVFIAFMKAILSWATKKFWGFQNTASKYVFLSQESGCYAIVPNDHVAKSYIRLIAI